MDNKEFGKKLKQMRISANKTVSEISAYLISLGYKATEKTIYSWEAGRSQPTPDPFMDMCNYYGVTDILGTFGYEKSPNTDESALGDDERNLLANLRTLTQEQQAVVLTLVRTVAARNQQGPSSAPASTPDTEQAVPSPIQS